MHDDHVNGIKHMKKVMEKKRREEEEQEGGKGSRGEKSSSVADRNKKALESASDATDLRSMLCQTDEPVIGLVYVEEVVPETNPESSYDAQYDCSLCGIAAVPCFNMFMHLTGTKHRLKLLAKRLGGQAVQGVDRAGAHEMAKEVEAEDGLRIELMKKVQSKTSFK